MFSFVDLSPKREYVHPRQARGVGGGLI